MHCQYLSNLCLFLVYFAAKIKDPPGIHFPLFFSCYLESYITTMFNSGNLKVKMVLELDLKVIT